MVLYQLLDNIYSLFNCLHHFQGIRNYGNTSVARGLGGGLNAGAAMLSVGRGIEASANNYSGSSEPTQMLSSEEAIVTIYDEARGL